MTLAEVVLLGKLKKVSKGMKKILIETAPNFALPDEKIEIIGTEDVGASFEPRLEVTYDVYFGKKYEGRYKQTLVFEKNLREVVCSVNHTWLSHSK